MRFTPFAWAALAIALAGGLHAESHATAKPSPEMIKAATAGINGDAIIANMAETKNWLNYGLGYDEARFSKLTRISTDNVGDPGLPSSHNTKSRRGVEATPIVVDGIMYATASWSVVHALDAVTGEELWVYDPEVDPAWGYKGCCDVVNRGVAIWDGMVYVGTYDGYLDAIDAVTGERVWRMDTSINRDWPYTITGAPRIIDGKVIIGNGGAEYGVRGYVTAYDVKTGEEAWRWFTVPGNPEEDFENAAMESAVETWDASGKWWEIGGGGTVWDAMAYDPDLNLLYIGVGNGTPWNRDIRSPGGGDNLYLASVVALNPDTGEYVWHYQHTPGESWDYTSTQHIILAELEIDGTERKVLMQAPKNGFFFVIDRETGEFISAENFVFVNWASGYDENGRPIEMVGARPGQASAVEVTPSALGAHNWHPMSYNPDTGLVYIPAQGIPITMLAEAGDRPFDQMAPNAYGTGTGWNIGYYLNAVQPNGKAMGMLIAWDPVAQKEVWRQQHLYPWNGGTLTTQGNLVFQGTADGRFVAYNAKTGEQLWEHHVGMGIIAAPMTWEKDGVQYVTIAAGWGGSYGVSNRHTQTVGPGTVFTFKVGGAAQMPGLNDGPTQLLRGIAYDPAMIPEGQGLYVANCAACHGVPAVGTGGNIPNLGYSDPGTIESINAIVLEGAMEGGGMPSFHGKLTEDDVTKITAFIQGLVDILHPQ